MRVARCRYLSQGPEFGVSDGDPQGPALSCGSAPSPPRTILASAPAALAALGRDDPHTPLRSEPTPRPWAKRQREASAACPQEAPGPRGNWAEPGGGAAPAATAPPTAWGRGHAGHPDPAARSPAPQPGPGRQWPAPQPGPQTTTTASPLLVPCRLWPGRREPWAALGPVCRPGRGAPGSSLRDWPGSGGGERDSTRGTCPRRGPAPSSPHAAPRPPAGLNGQTRATVSPVERRPRQNPGPDQPDGKTAGPIATSPLACHTRCPQQLRWHAPLCDDTLPRGGSALPLRGPSEAQGNLRCGASSERLPRTPGESSPEGEDEGRGAPAAQQVLRTPEMPGAGQGTPAAARVRSVASGVATLVQKALLPCQRAPSGPAPLRRGEPAVCTAVGSSEAE